MSPEILALLSKLGLKGPGGPNMLPGGGDFQGMLQALMQKFGRKNPPVPTPIGGGSLPPQMMPPPMAVPQGVNMGKSMRPTMPTPIRGLLGR